MVFFSLVEKESAGNSTACGAEAGASKSRASRRARCSTVLNPLPRKQKADRRDAYTGTKRLATQRRLALAVTLKSDLSAPTRRCVLKSVCVPVPYCAAA